VKDFEEFSVREKKHFVRGAIAGGIVSFIMSYFLLPPILHPVLQPVYEFFGDTVGRTVLEIATLSGRYNREQRRKGIEDAAAHAKEDVGATQVVLTIIMLPLGAGAGGLIGNRIALIYNAIEHNSKVK
jgi:hypothetical protein